MNHNFILSVLIVLMIFIFQGVAFGAWGGGCKSASLAGRTNTTISSINKDKKFGGYIMSGFKSDYFLDQTAEVYSLGNWYNQPISKKYKLNGLIEGFGSYEGWKNSLFTYGATISLNYSNWFSVPITYTVYDYNDTANQEVLEGYLMIRY